MYGCGDVKGVSFLFPSMLRSMMGTPGCSHVARVKATLALAVVIISVAPSPTGVAVAGLGGAPDMVHALDAGLSALPAVGSAGLHSVRASAIALELGTAAVVDSMACRCDVGATTFDPGCAQAYLGLWSACWSGRPMLVRSCGFHSPPQDAEAS